MRIGMIGLGRMGANIVRRITRDGHTAVAYDNNADTVAQLRATLEPLAGDPDDPAHAPLMGGLEPYPDNWRADVRPPETLPHFPMVLHRGGFPDGS